MADVARAQMAYGETPEEVRALLQRGAVEALGRGFVDMALVLVTELALGMPADPDWLAVGAARDFVALLREAA